MRSVSSIFGRDEAALPTASTPIQTVITRAKPSSTSRAADTIATTDPDFRVALAVGAYAFELWLTDGTGANSRGGLKGTMSYSGSFSSGQWGMTGSGEGTTPVPLVKVGISEQQMQTQQSGQGSLWITGSIITTTPGVLSFDWAQQKADLIESIVSAGSWMRVTKFPSSENYGRFC
jgi:hypothetical protein